MREMAEILQNVYFASSIGSPGADSVQCVWYMLMPTHSSVPSQSATHFQQPLHSNTYRRVVRRDWPSTWQLYYDRHPLLCNDKHSRPTRNSHRLSRWPCSVLLPLSLYLRPTSTPKVICSQTCSQICCHSEISCMKYFIAPEHPAPSYRRLFAIWKR